MVIRLNKLFVLLRIRKILWVTNFFVLIFIYCLLNVIEENKNIWILLKNQFFSIIQNRINILKFKRNYNV